MFVGGEETALKKQIVSIVDREKALIAEQRELMEKFDSAENTKNADEMQRLGSEAYKLDRRINMFILLKVTVMTMVEDKNPQYHLN